MNNTEDLLKEITVLNFKLDWFKKNSNIDVTSNVQYNELYMNFLKIVDQLQKSGLNLEQITEKIKELSLN